MLSVATASSAVHCSEAAKSSSNHSGLGNSSSSWNSDHTSLKRKQSPIRDLTSDYGFSSEITLTVVTNDANGYKRQRRDSEKSLNSSVTLRYKDPKTKAPTEKMLDNNVRHSFDASSELSTCPKESNDCYQRFNRPEITIYQKKESEKQPPQAVASTSSKAAAVTHQGAECSRTVFKVSREVDIISPKSSQKVIEAAIKQVPDHNDNTSPKSSSKFDANNNPKTPITRRLNNALALLQSLDKPSTSTPAKAAVSDKLPILRSTSREKIDNNNQWSEEIFTTDNCMQSISSSIPFSDIENDFDNSYYTMGFPNPPGENRCWVNATVHALFALPFTDSLDRMNLSECTSLMKTLILMQALWRKGESEKHNIYSMLRKFKEELIVLDDSYPSERQQDVSEFLMKLLNHFKTFFEKRESSEAKIQEIENMPENPQDQRKSKTTPDSSKRRPLVELRENSNLFEPGASQKSNKVERLPNGVEDSKENLDESIKNPVDDYFLLPIVDQYSCKGCSEKKQKRVDNLVVFIQVPPESKDVPVNVEDAIARNFTTEERRVTCDHCKHKFQDVRTAFSNYPKVLTVHVHRYGIGEHGTRKISNALSIPEQLVLKPSLMIEGFDADEIYKPVCIISHVGENVDCGHYTSYVEHEGQWYYYNDMSVSPMTSSQVFAAAETTAYLIFFVNVNLLEKQHTEVFKINFN
ncbi:uncharacterized protein LOC122507417 [Leptopilina heterotoma]|uniref:uncharacterized protein LOC122507417 n=1 Tax=Leptopilina heterotoma TaxID=63436 RepID=UPI001CA983E2|nr:uncharacterized protein LOC122507417 [Leptopilina heterotoma]